MFSRSVLYYVSAHIVVALGGGWARRQRLWLRRRFRQALNMYDPTSTLNCIGKQLVIIELGDRTDYHHHEIFMTMASALYLRLRSLDGSIILRFGRKPDSGDDELLERVSMISFPLWGTWASLPQVARTQRL